MSFFSNGNELRNSLRDSPSGLPPSPLRGTPAPEMDMYSPAYQQLKQKMHRTLLERVDLERLQKLTTEQFRRELSVLVERIVEDQRLAVNQAERKQLVLDMQNEMLGLGPIEPLLDDSSVSDILVNTCKQVYVERRGKLERTDIRFTDDAPPAADHRQDRLQRGPAHR